jgi:hypothetical protein
MPNIEKIQRRRNKGYDDSKLYADRKKKRQQKRSNGRKRKQATQDFA